MTSSSTSQAPEVRRQNPVLELSLVETMGALRQELCTLLMEVVDLGASVGFLPPLARPDASRYWLAVQDEIYRDQTVLLAAQLDDSLAGAVQLALSDKPNALHRAELRKLMVGERYQRQGVGRALVQRAEQEALRRNRTLLVLDTRQGDAAAELYKAMGYTEFGIVPGYAQSANGDLHSTVFFYKQLKV